MQYIQLLLLLHHLKLLVDFMREHLIIELPHLLNVIHLELLEPRQFDGVDLAKDAHAFLAL